MSVLLDALKKAAQQKQDSGVAEVEKGGRSEIPSVSQQEDLTHVALETAEIAPDKVEAEEKSTQGIVSQGLKLSLASEELVTGESRLGNESQNIFGSDGQSLESLEGEPVSASSAEQLKAQRDEQAYLTEAIVQDSVLESVAEGAIAEAGHSGAEEGLRQTSEEAAEDTKQVVGVQSDRADESEVITSFDPERDGSSLEPLPQAAAVTPGAAAVLAHQSCSLEEVSLSPGVGARIRQVTIFLLIPIAFALIIFYSATEWFGLLEKEFTRQVNLHRFNQVKYEYNRIAQLDSQTGVMSKSDSSVGQISADENEKGGEKWKDRTASGVPVDAVSSAVSHFAALRRQQTARSVSPDQGKHRRSKAEKTRAEAAKSPHAKTSKRPAYSGKKKEVPVAILKPSYETRIESLMDEGQFDRALEVVNEWRQHDPSPSPLYYQGVVLARAGKTDAALQALKTVLAKDPFNLDAVELMCSIKTDCGMSLEGLTHYHELFPASKVIAISLAQQYVDQGALDSAIGVLSETFRLEPDADVAFNLAQLLLARGDRAGAARFVQEASLLAKQQVPSFSETQLSELISQVAQ